MSLEHREAALELMGAVQFELRVRAGTGEVTVDKALKVKVGATIQLETTTRDPVDLICGEVVVARGEIISNNGALQFRVTEVLA